MQKGIVISNISDLYHVELENGRKYTCNARGKFKNGEISPVAGDKVEIEIIDEEKKTGVINQIKKRVNETKRPKMANLTQLILVLSMKLPKPDLELLDKQLAYTEYMGIKPVIVLNKIDLVDKATTVHIKEIYQNIGYTVIETNAKEGTGVEELKRLLNDNITAFSGNSGVRKINFNKFYFRKRYDK